MRTGPDSSVYLADMGIPNADQRARVNFDLTPLVNTGKLRVL
jgi:hypothetical protein